MEQYSPGESNVRERYGLPRDAHVVGFVGRLTRDKGLPELVEAFDEILRAEPETYLLLVGWFDASEDVLGRGVRRRIESHPRIRLTGFVEGTAAYYRAMDVMVLPTWREGFPNVVLEAAATGIPVVTTMSTGSRDSVVPEVTGLLIPPGYPEAISEAVLKLLRDPERRLRMGQAARAWVLEHYIDERVLGLTADYYLRHAEAGSRRSGRLGIPAWCPARAGKSSGCSFARLAASARRRPADANQADHFQGLNGLPGHINSLRIRARVRRSEQQAGTFDQRQVVGRQALQFFAVGKVMRSQSPAVRGRMEKRLCSSRSGLAWSFARSGKGSRARSRPT